MNSRRRAQTWPYPRARNYERLLRGAAKAWFEARRFETNKKMPYCLARWEDWPKNLVLPEVADYVLEQKARAERERRPYPLHKYVHHGLSSQAHAFNLIGPLIVRDDLAPLAEVFAAHDVAWPEGASVAFEYEDRTVFNEDGGQPTSIDIVVADGSAAPRIFIEHKLTEKEFGSCSVFTSGDCDGRSPATDHSHCFLHHIGRRYWEHMDAFGFSQHLATERQCPLAAHYQFFREVLLSLEKGGTFVLLSDARSPVFHSTGQGGAPSRGLMSLLCEMVPEQHRGRVVSVSVQEVVEAVRRSGRHGDWVGAYGEKYAIA